MPKSRLEAFADGIFAVAATLLIVNVTVPGTQALGRELKDIWPSYVAYAISFITIGIIWINHHTVLDQIGRVNRLFLVLNVLFLMFIAFIPFPTRLLAQNIGSASDAGAAAVLYGAALTMTAVLFNALWRYAAIGRRLIRADADARVVAGINRSYFVGPFVYGFATLVALVSPRVSAVLYAVVALFYVIEVSLFGRR